MAELRHQIREALRRALGPPDEFTPRQIAQLTEIVRNVDRQSSPPLRQEASGAALEVLDFYATSAPDPQVTVDLFAGEWASRFPAPLQDVKAGQATLFEAEMITWGVDRLGGVSGKRVIEIGPLEGGHTYMIDRLGAREIVAVEANSRAYLKCLLVKELLGIPSATFLYGDAIAYLEAEIARGAEPVDLCLASGVLYHMVNPVAALRVMTAISDNLLLWTMYWDDQIMKGHPELAEKFPDSTPSVEDGFVHTLYRQQYLDALTYKGFCGGAAPGSAWLNREDLFRALDHFGFDVLDTGYEGDNGYGACLALVARRRDT